VVLTAGVQDRDGAKPVLLDTRLRTRVRFVFADGAFAGRLLDWAQTLLATTLHIVRKPAGQQGFAVIPRRWAVARTFAWLTAHRRLARDYERHSATSEAMIRWAAIDTITRRIRWTQWHLSIRLAWALSKLSFPWQRGTFVYPGADTPTSS
jgi:transposase